MITSTVTDAARRGSHDDYQPMIAAVHEHFRRAAPTNAPLFTTDAADLWTSWLDALPASERQNHNCHACRQFVERFGGMVTVDAAGMTAPAIWHEEDAPDAYKPAIAAMARLVRKAKVTGVFLSSEEEWGESHPLPHGLTPVEATT